MQIDYSRFTEKARAAITGAYRQTLSCQYSSIEPQVMMVSLIGVGRDMVFFLLQKMNVDRIAFCQAIGDSMAALQHAVIQQPSFSPELEKVLAKAQQLSSESGSSVVAMEHIFWAFSVVGGPVKDVMLLFGITEQKVALAVNEFRNGSMGPEEPSAVEENKSSPRNNLRALNKYAINLSVYAEEGKIEPVIGRDDEVRRILQILSRKTKNNPVLVGPPGTGKTAIVEGLAHRIIRGDVPQELSGLRIWSLDMTALMAGTSQHGEFEERLKSVVEDAKSDPNIVLFIDEMHLLMGAGGSMDAANILKPELARGELKVLGATTTDEYVQYVEKDKAFARRFQKVIVDEPDTEAAIAIIRGIKQRFETFHRIKILDEAVVSSVRLSQRYITDRFLPDKAIDLIDEAASRMRIARSSVPVELDDLSRQIRCKEMERESLRQDEQDHDLTALDAEIASLREKENELNARWLNERQLMEDIQKRKDEMESLKARFEQEELAGHYEEAVALRSRMDALKTELESVQAEASEESGDRLLKINLDEDDIRQVITSWTGIPVNRLSEDDLSQLSGLEDTLSRCVVGQDRAVSAVSKVIRRNKMGFGDAGRPIGSFLFLGTTGVGKTELAKTLADYLFHSRDMMVRIDMSEYQQEHSVARLFGAPPGYVGYDQGGQLTEAVRRKPYSVILLDEIEKANPKVFETLLQVLDDGRMTDGQGRVVDFKNTIIIMTSNMGASAITQTLVGGERTEENVALAKEQVLSQMRQRVAPEFINRIDDIVMFMPLGWEEIARIVAIQFAQLQRRMKGNGMDIRIDDRGMALLTAMSYEPEYGARPVKRAINDSLVNEVTMKLLSREITKDHPILVSEENGSMKVSNIEE